MKARRASGLVLACTLAAGSASASILEIVQHVELDPATSVAARESGTWVFEDDGFGNFVARYVFTRTETRLAGSFDLLLTTYVWDEDYFGNPVANPSSETWVSFRDPAVAALDANLLVDLALSARLSGDQFAGDNGPCSFPMDPWTYCSGWSTGYLSSMSGTLTGASIVLNGVFPEPGFWSTGTTTYTINGTVDPARDLNAVPTPAPFLLLIPALATLPRLRTRRA
jgi:hypothetical protein